MHRNKTLRLRTLLLLTLCAALAMGSVAQAEAKVVSGQSLYRQAQPGMSKAEIKALCAEILARETSSKVAMLDVAQLYLHGKLLGVSCAKVDYYRAYTLCRDAGADFETRAALNFIRERANGGNKQALAALAKIEKN